MQVETLGDALTHSWVAKMACNYGRREGLKHVRECMFRMDLDMETLVCAGGRDFPIARLAERLRCPRCGSREIRLMWDIPSLPTEKTARMS